MASNKALVFSTDSSQTLRSRPTAAYRARIDDASAMPQHKRHRIVPESSPWAAHLRDPYRLGHCWVSPKPPMSTRRVRPCVSKRSETRLAFGNCGKGIQQIPGGAGQTVEPGHHQHVPSFKLIKYLTKLTSVGF